MHTSNTIRLMIDETYIDLKDVVNHSAWRFAREFYQDPDECLGVAHWSFMKAVRSYKHDKGTLETWVRWCVWKDLLEWWRTNSRHARILDRIDGHDMTTVPSPQRRTIDDLLQTLSDDAAYVAQLALQPPEKARDVASGPHPFNMRRALRLYLADLGWTTVRILKAFDEIRRTL